MFLDSSGTYACFWTVRALMYVFGQFGHLCNVFGVDLSTHTYTKYYKNESDGY